jgi:hypothetical protein
VVSETSYTFSLLGSCQRIHPRLRPRVAFRNVMVFCSEGLLASRITPKAGEQPLLAVRDCLFSTFTATLRTWLSSQPSKTQRRHETSA